MSTLSIRIKKERENLNMTREELANKLGVSYSAIAMYEQGNREPNNELTIKMCEIFNCSMDYLMGLSTYKNPKEDLEKELFNFDLTEEEYYEAINCFMNDNITGLAFLIFYGGLEETKEQKVLKTILHYILDYYPDKNKINDLGEQERFEKELEKNLRYGKKMLLSLDKNKIIHNYNKNTSNAFPLPDTPIKLPILGKIAAGMPILAVENIEGYEFAPSSHIKKGYEYFYLKVSGDSMNLKFNENDIVLIQKQDFLENGEIGVILVNGFDATIKKFQQKNGFVFLEPMSSNPTHQVQIYDPKETEIKIIGKAVSYQGKIN